MIKVTTKIIIAAPKEEVSAYASDPDNAPLWYKNIKSVEWRTGKQLSIGSRIVFKAKVLGKELAYIYEIKEYVPGKYFVISASEGPFPMTTVYEWEAIDKNTGTLNLRDEGTPSGFSKLFSPFMKAAMKRANKKRSKTFKIYTGKIIKIKI